MTPQDDQRLLEIRNLKVQFALEEGTVRAVDGMNLAIDRGQTVGVVGESGCGKSVTAQALLRIVPKPGEIVEGELLYYRPTDGDGGHLHVTDLAGLPANGDEMRDIRGNEIVMVFQEPMSSLAPVYTIGHQIMEAIELHQHVGKQEARERTLEILQRVGMPQPTQTIDSYPHQMSGGMRQRGMIAIALSCNPTLLIADEPTTALDVTTQGQILGTDAEAAERLWHGHHVHHARPGRGCQDDRVRDGDVPRQGGGVRGRGHHLPRSQAPLHQGAVAFDAAHGSQVTTAGGSYRHGSGSLPRTAGLSLPSSL